MENTPVEAQLTAVHESTEKAPSVGKKMKFKLPPKKYLYLIGAVVVIVLVLFFGKSYLVAARVNGSFISKSSLIKEMERTAGQESLDSLIITKLVEDKVKDVEMSDDEIAAEIKKTDDSLTAQGTTLAEALASRGISEKEYRGRITTQLKLKKLVADKTTVTEDEITKYLVANKTQLPKGVDQKTLRAQAADTIEQNKFNQEVGTLIDTLKAEAKITYYIKF